MCLRIRLVLLVSSSMVERYRLVMVGSYQNYTCGNVDLVTGSVSLTAAGAVYQLDSGGNGMFTGVSPSGCFWAVNMGVLVPRGVVRAVCRR